MTPDHELRVSYEQESPTEVVDRLRGMKGFLSKIENAIFEHPEDNVILIATVGEPGIGKSTIAGQISEALRKRPSLTERLEASDRVDNEGRVIGTGRELGFVYLSLAILDVLQKRGILKTPGWGGFFPEEYAQTSDVMADLIALTRNFLLRDKNKTWVILLDTVGVTDPVDRGAFAVYSQGFKKKFAVFVKTDIKVQRESMEFREAVESCKTVEEFKALITQHGFVWDEEMNEKDLEDLKRAFGNVAAIIRNAEDLNNAMYNAKGKLGKDCPDFTLEGLVTNPVLRARVQSRFYPYLAKKWGIPLSHTLIRTNEEIQKEEEKGKDGKRDRIHVYYKRITQGYGLLRNPDFLRFLRERVSVLNRITEPSDRVD